MDSWLATLEKGAFQIPLTSLTFLKEDGERDEGSGQLTWRAAEGIRIHATTTSEAPFFDPGSPYATGKLPAPTDYLMLEGRTPDDGAVICTFIFDDRKGLVFGSNVRVWEIAAHCAHRYEQLAPSPDSRLLALLKPSEVLRFSQSSTITDDNPHFGKTSRCLDCLAYTTSFGNVALRAANDQMIQLSISGQLDLESSERALESVRCAIGFVEGRSLGLIGYEAVAHGFAHRKVYSSLRTRSGKFSPPLPQYVSPPGSHDALLRCATEFFHTDRGREYSDSLRMCWDCADNYASIKAVATCAALENLLRLVFEDAPAPKLSEEDARKAQAEQQQEMRQLNALYEDLEGNRARYGDSVVNRVLGVFRSSHQKQPKNVLWTWKKHGILGVEKEDIDAWNDLRNSVAHGHLAFNDREVSVRQVSLYRQDRVDNLINKLILQAIGYEGAYFDYSKHRVMRFPIAHHLKPA